LAELKLIFAENNKIKSMENSQEFDQIQENLQAQNKSKLISGLADYLDKSELQAIFNDFVKDRNGVKPGFSSLSMHSHRCYAQRFYDIVVSDQKMFDLFMHISEFLEFLKNYRAYRIYESFHDDFSPFKEIDYRHNKNVVTFIDYQYKGLSFNLEVSCIIDKYMLILSGDNTDPKTFTYLKELKERIDDLALVKTDDGMLLRYYQFPKSEKKIRRFIRIFKEELKDIQNFG
jgi:hypothetical protein